MDRKPMLLGQGYRNVIHHLQAITRPTEPQIVQTSRVEMSRGSSSPNQFHGDVLKNDAGDKGTRGAR